MDPSIVFDNCLFERDFHLGADSSGIPWWICQWCHQMLSYHEWETVHLLKHLQDCLGKDHEISTEGRGTFDRQLQAGRVRGGALSSDNGSNSTTHPVYHPTYEAHAMFPRPIQRVKARDPDSWEEVDFYPYEAEHGELFLSVWRKLEGWRLTGVWQPFPRPEVIGYCRRTGMFEVGSDENGRIAWRCKVCRVLILQDWDIHETMTLHNKVCVIIRWCEATEAGCQCPVPKCIMHEEGMSERPASVPADLPDDLQPA